MKSIANIVEKILGITEDQLKGRSREKVFVFARMLLVGLANSAGYSSSYIAKYLNRDHSTILHLKKGSKENDAIIDYIEQYKSRVKVPVFSNIGKVGAYTFVYNEYEGKCAVCSFDSVVEVCHIFPRCLGGSDDLENLILLCPNHHTMLDKGLLFIKDIHKKGESSPQA